jgi:type VI secretion system ImpC/EvpB family protein
LNSTSSPKTTVAATATQVVEELPGIQGTAHSLLDQLLAQTRPVSVSPATAEGPATSQASSTVPPSGQLEAFLKASTVAEGLRLWLGDDVLVRLANAKWSTIARQLQAAVARIDRLLSEQVSRIIHHPAFQKLEASWRGVEYLVKVREEAGDAQIVIRVLNVSYAELSRDFDKALEFDQSQLFRKVYEQEFGIAGGSPYGVILADYDIHPRPSREHPFDDMAVLRSLSQVAAAAFCPIVLNASPSMFGHDSYEQMQVTVDYEKVHHDLSFLSWRSFRETEDSRFIALAMPRMKLRHAYADRSDRHGDFPYYEPIAGRQDCLWGGAAFAMGEVLMRAFAESRWLANIRGAQRADSGGGLVRGIGSESFATESSNSMHKPLTEIHVGDSLERQMVELGFLPLCACKDMPLAAFYSCPSAQKAKVYQDGDATANARLSAMLNYMLCVSRFAHYVKVIGRDKVGAFLDASVLEQQLQNWINGYVTADSEASTQTKSRYPLREADLQVVPVPGKPGAFDCVFRLVPHYELEDMQASIKLRTELIRSF